MNKLRYKRNNIMDSACHTIKGHLPGQKGKPKRTIKDNRSFMNWMCLIFGAVAT